MSASDMETETMKQEDDTNVKLSETDSSLVESAKSEEKSSPKKKGNTDTEKMDSDTKQQTPKKGDDAEKSNTSKSENKTPKKAKKEESSEEDNDGDDDEKVPLLDQPLELSGRRDRRKTQRFTEELDKKTENRSPSVQTIPQGHGTPLGEIPSIEVNLKRAEAEVLKTLHRVLYGRIGKATTLRKFIRQFNGFDFKRNSEQYDKKRILLNKTDNRLVRGICKILCIKQGIRDEMAKSILDFLLEPKNIKENTPKSKSGKKQRKSRARSNKNKKHDDDDDISDSEEENEKKKGKKKTLNKKAKTSAKSKTDTEESVSEDDDSDSEEEPAAKKKTPARKTVSKDKSKKKAAESNTDATDDSDSEDKSKKVPARRARGQARKNLKEETSESEEEKSEHDSADEEPKAKKSKIDKKPTKSKASTKTNNNNAEDKDTDKSGSDGDKAKDASDSDSDHELLAKKTEGPPDDEAIRSCIQEILKGANLEEITMKTVCRQVYEKYPKFDLSHKKDFIKSTVKSTPCCGKIYTCRFCHDENENHPVNRKDVTELVCTNCDTRQPVQAECQQCSLRFGKYTCLECKLFDDEDKNQYHCDGCGICRIGGRDKFFHCERCNMCLPNKLQNRHKCVENVSRSNCPVCLEDIHTSRIPCHIPECGHLVHRTCFEDLLTSGHYACPTCQTSMLDMTQLWAYLDHEVEMTPMPPDYKDYYVDILCKDCHMESTVKFHVVGLKCLSCGSYNTCRIKGASVRIHAAEARAEGARPVEDENGAASVAAGSDDADDSAPLLADQDTDDTVEPEL